MAKRKAAKTSKRTAARASGGRGARTRKTAARKTAGRKTSRRAGRAPRRATAKTARQTSARPPRSTKTSGGRTKTARAKTARATTRTGGTRQRAATVSRKTAPRPAAPARRAAPAAAKRRKPAAVPLRKPPALDRQRRTIVDEDLVPTPPSSLDLDRSASAVRTGRRELQERYDEHTETSPALTGGDVDADWESPYSVGDEAPGGDNPTPDQDIVDDIGRAVGVQYQDNEELKGEDKIAQRDRHRWELDPASSEDYDER